MRLRGAVARFEGGPAVLHPEPSTRRQLLALLAGGEKGVDLARASLLLACEEYPGLDVDAYLARLDAMAGLLRERMAVDPAVALSALNHILFEEEGFRGNTREYYDPRNSLLSDVLDRRTGIPITLSTVYIAVARRAGLSVEGVGLPGHFLVRVVTAAGEALVDPFHLGTVLTDKDCQDRLDRIYGGRVRLGPDMLAACPPRAMLSRMVRNLKAIYAKEGDGERALRAADLLVLLNPGVAEELRDRGLLLAALECYALAARDLEAYVSAVPQTPGTDQLRARASDLRRKASRLN